MAANREIGIVAEIERQRSRYAYECVENVANNHPYIKENYKAYVRKIPMLIKVNGLGGALAFVYSKKKEKTDDAGYAYHLIYDQTDKWLKGYHIKNIFPQVNAELVKKIINLESDKYRVVNTELLALYKWMGRFAEGMLKGDEKDA